MNDLQSRVPSNAVAKRRWLLAVLVALLFVGGVTMWLFGRDNRASVTLRIDDTSITAHGQLKISFSVELRGRKIQYFLEERRADGQGRLGGSRVMTFFDWLYYMFVVNGLSETGRGAGTMTLGSYPPEAIPPVGIEFKVYSGETKVILSTGEGESKSELTLRCE